MEPATPTEPGEDGKSEYAGLSVAEYWLALLFGGRLIADRRE